jgi:hypothetical protein
MQDYYPEQTAKLRDILEAQIKLIVEKDNQYRGSWKKRGGRGAWYTMARPIDRLENLVELKYGGDIFAGLIAENGSKADGTILACLHDIRSYALLVEAWFLLQKNPYTANLQSGLSNPAAMTKAMKDDIDEDDLAAHHRASEKRKLWHPSVGEGVVVQDAKPMREWWCLNCKRIFQAPDVPHTTCPQCSAALCDTPAQEARREHQNSIAGT